jgi:hypothetical protein
MSYEASRRDIPNENTGMKRTLGLFLILMVPAAGAEPWLCTDEQGYKQFSYDPASAQQKNCVHHPIPSTNYVRVRPRPETAADRAPAFPKVSARAQQKRDAMRREILERELAEERKSLEAAMRALEEQKRLSGRGSASAAAERLRPYVDRVRVHQNNIANLRKELDHEG